LTCVTVTVCASLAPVAVKATLLGESVTAPGAGVGVGVGAAVGMDVGVAVGAGVGPGISPRADVHAATASSMHKAASAMAQRFVHLIK